MNRILVVLLSLIAMIFLTCCPGRKPELKVYDLKCENLTDPPGTGTSAPRLGWKVMSSVNGDSHLAYQVIAASDKHLLSEKKADLWNSGKTESSENILIKWQGKVLLSGSVCYWKVRVWNKDGKASDWSETASFTTGLLKNSEWQGDYIGLSDSSEYCVSPQMKREFEIEKPAGRFLLHVNSLGYHEVWVNGLKAGENVLAPAVSQFDKRSLSITYDITPLIKKGSNTLILWTGQGWYSKGLPGVDWNGPLVRAQVERIKGMERQVILFTDSTWVARASGYSTIGNWRPHQFGGELIDGSLLSDNITNGNLSWLPVSIVKLPEREVSPQTTEANRITDTIKAVSVTRINDSTWLADMGTTLTGWFSINFRSLKPRQEISILYSDHLDNDGKTVNQGQIDRYIASGAGEERFINKFNYHGFRYAMITNLAEEPSREDISAYLIHTDFRQASTFECSDEDLDKIYNMINYTLRCLSLGGYLVDCPQIERLGYGGDGNASTMTAQTMFDLAPLYSNWLQAWEDCVRDDGGMPHTAPNPYSAGGGPYWCGFIITASWNAYLNYGDAGFLKRYYPVMQKWLGYAEKYSPQGLLEGWPETEYRSWYLGDWAVPEGINQTDPRSIGLVNNCFMTVCYETMNKIAVVLGLHDDAR
ncbi:MAG: family 78 glycoside hydrolase catalytic domain, partial [Bacteroidales bacterium]|nr:family 78 glycoside hydrolase catalytic domain [Bacteroidales bacterium]